MTELTSFFRLLTKFGLMTEKKLVLDILPWRFHECLSLIAVRTFGARCTPCFSAKLKMSLTRLQGIRKLCMWESRKNLFRHEAKGFRGVGLVG